MPGRIVFVSYNAQTKQYCGYDSSGHLVQCWNPNSNVRGYASATALLPESRLTTGVTVLTRPRAVLTQMGAAYAGQMGANEVMRRVILSGEMTVAYSATWLATSNEAWEDSLKTYFNSAGWSCNNITITGGSYFGGSGKLKITIDLNVRWEFTAEQARLNAITALQNYWQPDSLNNLHYVFSNISLYFDSEESRTTITPEPPARDPGGNNTTIGDRNNEAPPDQQKDFFTQIGEAVGFGGVGAVIGAATGGLLVLGIGLFLLTRQK